MTEKYNFLEDYIVDHGAKYETPIVYDQNNINVVEIIDYAPFEPERKEYIEQAVHHSLDDYERLIVSCRNPKHGVQHVITHKHDRIEDYQIECPMCVQDELKRVDMERFFRDCERRKQQRKNNKDKSFF